MKNFVVCLIVLVVLGASANPSPRDLERANQPRPTVDSHVYGAHPRAAWEAMNKFLLESDIDTVPCEHLTHEELNEKYRNLMVYMDERFDEIYQARNDRRALKYSPEEIFERWAQEAEKTLEDGFEEGSFHYNTLRDGKCAETVMWWVHHLTETAQEELRHAGFVLPLMPEEGPVESDDHTYVYQIQCTDCHSSPSSNSTSSVTPSLPNPHGGKVGDNEETCPIDPNTGLPTVWYQDPTLAGQRYKRCDWDYDPPCQMCEGRGGLIWGDQEDEIHYAKCKPVMKPEDIPKDNLTTPTWPMEFEVNESTILINQINTGGQFPGSDPCAAHNFKNQTEVMYYDGTAPQSRTHTYGLTDTSDIWALADGNMFIKIQRAYCICITPYQNGDPNGPIIGPLRYNFAEGSVLIGREYIELEFRNGEMVLADHWSKGPHHFWYEVSTNKMVRGWQPYNGLNIYYDWKVGPVNSKEFVVDKSCYQGNLYNNISCAAPYPPQN